VTAGRVALALAAAAWLVAAPARGWFTGGHQRAARAAVAVLPGDLPAFFRNGEAAIAGSAGDPDLFKGVDDPAVATLRRAEQPEHYVDVERLPEGPLPANRTEYAALLQELGRPPGEVGSLTLAVTEWSQRLTLCFVEHRARPRDPHVRAKCLVFAGELAHYAADLAQPLHTTIHHNGRARPDGSSPGTGIHFKVDALFQRRLFDEREAIAGLDAQPFADLAAGIADELRASHARVARVYELERWLENDGGRPRSEVAQFARERFRATALFVARLFTTAWRTSQRLELPEGLRREAGPGKG
jgi:hypothetical protein